ncbi:putative midasin [Rosellinia necatrix]|uniref:Midasin n=1 Tax=Rosellinia necatrix TaxID=77044 RepID=A0A1W2TEP1_ROSNE|nr:putative midasin [Rosellinia necatrix]
MADVDVSLQRAQLLDDEALLGQLPPELLEIIRNQTAANFLDAIAAAALIPQTTSPVFIYFEHVFADICARWLLKPRNFGQEDQIIAAFARILPFAPHLSVFLEQYISETSVAQFPGARPFTLNSLNSLYTGHLSGPDLSRALVAFWRLVNFDRETYGPLVQPSQVQALFKHELASVRYLAVKVLCCQLNASDLKEEELMQIHVNHESIPAESLCSDLDGMHVDYAFLSLFEHKRAMEMDKFRSEVKKSCAARSTVARIPLQRLTDQVIQYGNVILPRPAGSPSSQSSLVHTPTTLANLESLAGNLQKPGPILLHGLPGSGKTSVVQELARELGMESSMVTLHLNEQTDAKMLIGLYSTDSKPGSFSWRPGVLTTAVREGRWVLIEDLDRAPNELMSTLLPLVEHERLLIPSRGETIRATSTFRLFATVRTTKGAHGQENIPNFLGQRFWNLSSMKIPSYEELEQIALGSYPLLHKYIPTIMSVYKRLCSILSMSFARTIERPVTPRDLLKWCRRLKEILIAANCKTGEEPISERTRDWMFMEAADCFCGGLAKQDTKRLLLSCIAEEMHLPKQLMEHYLDAYVPQMDDSSSNFKIGRVMLMKKHQGNRVVKSKKPFANTSHAKRLLEQIAVAVKLREPVLLVGETGIGKTTVVQQLADTLGHRLVAVNLSQQSEIGDLIGGFKPVNARSLAVPLREEFEDLFASTGISATKNQKYLEQIGKCTAKGQWSRVSKLWREAPKMFGRIVDELQAKSATRSGDLNDVPAMKRRKTESKLQSLLDLRPRWDMFSKNLDQFDVQVSGGSGNFAFAFVEGNIVKAARNGDWVLLDEINLASPDTLESIADLLASGPNDQPSILLSETGEIERVKAHPSFRLFGAMNPATDIGKRDLPLGLRSRFTELYVGSPDKDLKDLLTIIRAYLSGRSAKDDQAADDIAKLYMNTKRRAEEKRLVDGANEVPHFSLRTLTRVLTYVNDVSPFYGLRRSLFEGFSMGFLTLLDKASEELLVPLIHHHLLDKHGNARSLLSQPPKHPSDGKEYVKFLNKNKDRHYWLLQGAETPVEHSDYIITPYIERNLLNLVRATSTRRFPILIQGPTSAGKTSMIEYLANYSGNKFVRINNHEHTDLQEYLGTYVSDASGKLRFQEGLLVQALRQGHWIVLDELNLAPTDVLEALNRLLDDNRELLIPETQEFVRPHENFMLFATQNPAGLYGGRKALSRAFRNRFLELHFDDIPEDELETILQKRSIYTAPSDCKRIVNVYKELSRLRQTSRLFENKDSFATLRDLFRWALRGAESREEIAANGFMLLAERVRNGEERLAVKQVIEAVFKVQIDQDQLYDLQRSPYLRTQPPDNSQGIVWTQAMRRLYVLVASALRHNEPVLLVGETGCGKTTVCQILAESMGKQLHIVNAHQNTETGDLIGSQRPVRNRGAIIDTLTNDVVQALQTLQRNANGDTGILLSEYHALGSTLLSNLPEDIRQRIFDNEIKSKALFEWADGSLVQAMRNGQYFLLDEISLADDSVLERLNSVLEPQRTILLAEKGVDNSFVRADPSFQFLATMNPGGDFGKRELSPALRNRFTEIWVPPLSDNDDILCIVLSKLDKEYEPFARVIVDFSQWFGQTFRTTASTAFSIRDILVWVNFINKSNNGNGPLSVIQGAATVFIDTLGANPSALIAIDPKSLDEQRQRCLDKLSDLIGCDATAVYRAPLHLAIEPTELRIGEYFIKRNANENFEVGFALNAPTTKLNAMRVIRALLVEKPILLEGSPGVGKTTLISALARACGQPLTRINLSDQTDLMDLFGTDIPVEGAEAGHFAWRDAPFLRAMQDGEWVLLDEMNLASQSVLEGLNACLDHRGEVYISELDQVFKRHPNFRLFAAQNPHHQGGGRKGLPSSFVNRFIVVYAEVFSDEDLLLIASHNFPGISPDIVNQMIRFISNLETRIVVEKAFGSQGSPWEFNLRDTLRWLHLLTSADPLLSTGAVDDFLNITIQQRFRSDRDRSEVNKLYAEVFGSLPKDHQLYYDISASAFQVGLAHTVRNNLLKPLRPPGIDPVSRLRELESLLICVKHNIPCILVGPSGCGKSVLLRQIASQAGKSLVTFPMNADIDTMDLIGGFEQSDPLREVNVALRRLSLALELSTVGALPQSVPDVAVDLLYALKSRNQQANDLTYVLNLIDRLHAQTSSGSNLELALKEAQDLLQRPTSVADPRFEWLDGVIIRALQMGEWLVLDNANLCNASVLDRLNSLLEPEGSLIINEHCEADGEPRIIKPHPDFRIFLTVDPRYGELSRAMRNRAVEIYVEPRSLIASSWAGKITDVEADLERYKAMLAAMSHDSANETHLHRLAIDSLSLDDLRLGPRISRLTNCSIGISSLYGGNLISEQVASSIRPIAPSQLTSDILYSTRKLCKLSAEQSSCGITEFLPLHPLQNSPIIPLLHESSSPLLFGMAVCYELSWHLSEAWGALELQRSQAVNVQISGLNRLQRSYIADEVPAVQKDSTARSSRFLVGILQALETYVRSELQTPTWENQNKSVFRDLIHSWKRTFHFLTQPTFEEATFQAHLGHMSTNFNDHLENVSNTSTRQLVTTIGNGLNECFISGFKLSTGLSMERLWGVLRPIPIQDERVFEQLVHMEGLAVQFDQVKWKSTAAPTDLAKIMDSFVQAYRLVRLGEANMDTLFQPLQTEIERMHTRFANESPLTPPLFAGEFETIRQLITIDYICRQDGYLPAVNEVTSLSDTSLVTLLRVNSSTNTSKSLQSIQTLTQDDRQLPQWGESLSTKVVRKLNSIGSESLSRLVSLETELPLIGGQISQHSGSITANQSKKLNEVLWHLMLNILSVCDSHLVEIFLAARNSLVTDQILESIWYTGEGLSFRLEIFFPQSVAHHLDGSSSTINKHFALTFVSLIAHQTSGFMDDIYLASAWIQFSLALVKLYIPDKVFDPQLRPLVELRSYDELFRDLKDQLQALEDYSKFQTGQTTSLRCDIIKEDILSIGTRPTVAQVTYRPKTSKLTKIQTEFNNILKVLLGCDLNSILFQHFIGSDAATQELQVIYENISRVSSRLMHSFRAYEDIMLPTVNILHCLNLGISLGREAKLRSALQKLPSTKLLGLVPFLGGKPGTPIPREATSMGTELLQYAAAVRSIDGLQGIGHIQQAIFEVIHDLYGQWTQKLEEDKKAEEAKNNLFRYRGGQEEEEAAEQAAFNELFPSFHDEEEDLPKPPKINNARGTAIKLAQMHRKIFLTPQNTQESLKILINHVINKICQTTDHGLGDRDLLSATLLALEGEATNLTATTTPTDYNFYIDTNITEARRLVSLVSEIRERFHQLQRVDEIGHLQPLADVVAACDTIFELSHIDPLAKVISKVEQLHAFVYEWQFGGWASKTYGALPLYTRLTDMLVSWRRLELSTWNKLFDMEIAKCNDDAASWWFIAYQAIISATINLSQNTQGFHSYALSLMKELENYFSSAPVGQFTGRLSLLKQLHIQLTLLVSEAPELTVIRDSLRNFIDFYMRYEKPVNDLIRSGRIPIEKQMKDVVLLASWKDTNIVALRESARKSHQKLFRIVRKFRDVLNQPMKLIIDKELPDVILDEMVVLNKPRSLPSFDLNAFDECDKNIPDWVDKYRRLANVQRTVQLMSKLSQLPESAIDAPGIIGDFLSNLNAQIVELRKETPSVLNDENKNIVKHLKSRKRKLFAETLKAVRQMGFPYNLGLDTLAKQGTLSTVLASTSPLTGSNLTILDGIDHYFYRILDLAPRVRNTAQTHSEDLTAAEINRSVGLFEGIMYSILRRRTELQASLNDLAALRESSDLLQSLAKARNGSKIQVGDIANSYRRSPAWLVEILGVGIQLVELHGKLGGLDNSKVLDLLGLWKERVVSLSTRLESLPVLPAGLITAEHSQVTKDLDSSFSELRKCLNDSCQERPDLAFLIEQIQHWAIIPGRVSSASDDTRQSIETLTQNIKTLCDSMLVAIEQFNKTTRNLCGSPDEPSWLLKHDEQLGISIQTLHMTRIRGNICNVLEICKQIDWDDQIVRVLGPSLVATVAPIVYQYESICNQFIQLLASSHQIICKLGSTLGKHFNHLASEGFCTPQEKTEESAGQSENLEGGTGLGDGEGAEDISKDIQPDEDLTELAQEKNADSNRDMEDEKDAVDMADEDLEGDNNSVDGRDDENGSNSDDDEARDEMDEERGDVDDLDPTAVDEKMWDGADEEEAEKDQKGDKPKGQKKKDEPIAAGEQPEAQDLRPDEGEQTDEGQDEEAGAEMEEDIQHHEEPNQQDPNVQDQDTLALPDDMEIDGNDNESLSSIDDDELDELSNADQQEKEEKASGDQENDEEEETEMDAGPIEDGKDDNMDQGPEDDSTQVQDDETMEQDQEEVPEEKDETEEASKSDPNGNNDHVVPSDARGGGQDQDVDQGEEHDNSQDSTAQREVGREGEDALDQDKSEGQKGSLSQPHDQPMETDPNDGIETMESNPFKALGNALEKWHRQQQDIKAAQENKAQQPNEEQDTKIKEFQHLENDEAAAEAQAMGTATEEQTQHMDDAMAIDDDEDQPPSNQILPEDNDANGDKDADEMDTSKAEEQQSKKDEQREERDTGVTTHQGTYNRDGILPPNGVPISEDIEDTIQETSTQLSSTHLEPGLLLRDYEESMRQWTNFQTKTHPLSLSLTSQLRLILTPSQSTKLSGSYRTGKRLNIKRIIPYIASSYKRDKIWMRRAIPTKRSYQILLCVDDSKSMGESSSGELALESLVMVSRALTMLEVGQIGVLGFGANAFMAHEFSEPFASHDAGAKVLQQFAFQQDYTNIQFLIRRTIDRFRLARQQSTTRGSEDLWQLALILSDGLTPSSEHENIQVLLREAIEERIMIVFIIMDDTTKKKEQSVLKLKKVKFLPNDEIRTEYYLDTFPFQYYLVVHNLEDLPGALAGLLRTWFAEVNSQNS